jgi:tetratricopeptide (TPR) repeat protein
MIRGAGAGSRRFAALLAAAALVAAPTAFGQPAQPAQPAPASDDAGAAAAPGGGRDSTVRAESRVEFAAGVAALEGGRARDALSHFEEAERLYPHYATAYNIGLCHRALGHPLEAAAAFQRYLAGAENDIPAAQFDAVAALIKEAETKIAKLTVRVTPADAALTVDGAGAQPAAMIRLNPGDHRVEVRAAGYSTATRVVRLASGKSSTVEIALSLEDAARAPRGPRLDAAFWALVGVSAVMSATGVVTGAIALSDSNAYQDPATPPDEADDRRSRGEVLRVVADVSFGLAIAGGVGAALLALLREPDAPSSGAAPSRAARSLRPGATASSSSASVVFVGAF